MTATTPTTLKSAPGGTGPTDPQRRFRAEDILPVARAAAAAAGVTRLADVTGLDRIGMPVWQAVRPLSRALSVHQGKGARDADAQVGALLEAVESHWAEEFDQAGPICRFDDLAPAERAPTLGDFAARGDAPPDNVPYRWAEARDVLTGDRLYLPFELVSLDFTRLVPSRFDRSSNGVAAGATVDEALAAALNELIERDAVLEWESGGLLHCTASTLRIETVPFDWFHFWRDRLRSLGIAVRISSAHSLTGTPVFVCELNDRSPDVAAYQLICGYGSHADPEVALFRALSEAIQARATYIAGAREDLFPYYRPPPADRALARFGLPLGAGMRGVEWPEILPGPVGSQAIALALAQAGYPTIAALELARPEGLGVVRSFAFGLGSGRRRRRAPQRR